MPGEHARLSPSSSMKWLNCPMAVKLEETLPEETSDAAAEGTTAHALAELKINKKFACISARKYNQQMKEIKAMPYYSEEMQKYTDDYLDYVTGIAMSYESTPYVASETKVSMENYAENCWGTCDCYVIGGDTLHVIDFKYGKSLNHRIDAEDNSQMKLYALGVLEMYHGFYSITKVVLHIFQPRIDNITSWEISRDSLLNWGVFTVRPKAKSAAQGEGDCCPGAWCDAGFCKARPVCKAYCQNDRQLIEDFGDKMPPLLTVQEVAKVLEGADHVKKWLSSVEKYAFQALMSGQEIPGFKLIQKTGNRTFTDGETALNAIVGAGYDKELLYRRTALPLTELEKLMGKNEFSEVCGAYITRPISAALAPVSDSRPAYNSIEADFSDTGGQPC